MKHLFLSSLMMVVLFVSCEKENLSPPPPPAKYVGQGYQGGIIFYVDASGQHGLIYAPTDELGQAPWGCYGTSLPGASNDLYGSNVVPSPGAGAENTIDIMNGCSEAGIAARLCGDLVFEGYSDWFLPSKKELNLLYINGFSLYGDVYWSSTQDNYLKAWHQDFSSGEQYNGTKGTSKNVIAVRSF